MGRSGHSANSDAELFRRAVEGAVPLKERQRLAPRAPARARATGSAPPPTLHVERDGDRIVAYRSGISRKRLRQLRDERPEATLDLHGLRVAEARARLSAWLDDCTERGRSKLLLVTGKGRHSSGPAVLRDVAIEALTGPLAHRILGLISAGRRGGGAGALYLLLERS